MADVGAAIRQYIVGRSAVSALISTRMFPDALPQNATMPAITYSKISTTHQHTISRLAGLASCRIQFDCFALTRSASNTIAQTIQQCGVIPLRGLTNGVDIRGVELVDGETTFMEPPTDGSQELRYVNSFDLMVHYQEGEG
jgi:hypothetical protein